MENNSVYVEQHPKTSEPMKAINMLKSQILRIVKRMYTSGMPRLPEPESGDEIPDVGQKSEELFRPIFEDLPNSL